MTGPSMRASSSTFAIPNLLIWLMAFLFLNVPVVAAGVVWLVAFPADWAVWEQVGGRLANGTLYEHGPAYNWVWSPIVAWLLAVAIVPLGFGTLMAIRVAITALLGWRLATLTVLSLPFWIDAINANLFTFSVVAGVLALRGNRWSALAFLALTCLMPRPVQIPLAVWLLWTRPDLRLPFIAMAGVSAAVVLGSGYAADWFGVLVSLAGSYGTPQVTLGPARYFGAGWLILAVPLSVWLTVKGRVGWAGMVLSPYLLPQYLLAILWEMSRDTRATPELSEQADIGKTSTVLAASPG